MYVYIYDRLNVRNTLYAQIQTWQVKFSQQLQVSERL